jgi:hypothetical protein
MQVKAARALRTGVALQRPLFEAYVSATNKRIFNVKAF